MDQQLCHIACLHDASKVTKLLDSTIIQLVKVLSCTAISDAVTRIS